jgi:Tetratricopeptide repeat
VLLGAARGNLAFIAVFEGDLDTAYELGQGNLELSRELGNLRGIAFALANLGLVHLKRGDTVAARPLFTEAREISQQIADPICEVYIVRDLGRVAWLEGDLIGAHREYMAALRLGHTVGHPLAVLTTLIDFVELLSTVEPARAARLLAAVEVLRDAGGMPLTRHEGDLRDATVERLRTVLSEADLAAAAAAGRVMSIDELVVEAFAVDPAAW